MDDKVTLRLDQRAIVEIVTPGATVLDLGCGRGELLAALVEKKQVRAQGIEVDDDAILQCVASGLNVFHDDIQRGLSEYGDESFDFIILNQTFQQMRNPHEVLKETLRVGRKAIVGFPNFTHLYMRFQLGIRGRAPVSPSLPYEWHDTPNLHFLGILDFIVYCKKTGLTVEQGLYFTSKRRVKYLPNLFAETALFVISNNAAR